MFNEQLQIHLKKKEKVEDLSKIQEHKEEPNL